MKNVYILSLILLNTIICHSQNLQNRNWYFGDKAALTFQFSPVAFMNNSAMNTNEACGSVSDQSGNLLFYTDGIKVWNKMHQLMTGSTNPDLNGNISSSQGALIVPKPGNNNIYYIVTIDGLSGNKKGLYYSTVDMSSGTYGAVIQKNVVMKDYQGINIDNNYANESEKITSTVHSNGIDYWIVTQIRDRINSYKVTSSGIATLPVSSIAPVNIVLIGSTSAGIGCMKISKDSQHIVIAYKERVYEDEPTGAIALGNFNNSTGIATFNTTLISVSQTHPYGVEFSPSGENVYFSTEAQSPWQNLSRLYKVKSSGLQLTLISQIDGVAALQLGLDNKIYIATSNLLPYISTLNEPDNFLNPGFLNGNINLGNGESKFGLPQWVHWQDPCPSNLILTSTTQDVASGQDNRQASNSITAYNSITNSGTTALYHAGTTVVLKPGFYAGNNAKFRGYIEGCTGEFVGRQGDFVKDEDEYEVDGVNAATEDISIFTISPNPSSRTVTIASTEALQTVMVTSFDNKVLFNREVNGKTSLDVDITTYTPGFYTITVVTQNGIMETQKLIKN